MGGAARYRFLSSGDRLTRCDAYANADSGHDVYRKIDSRYRRINVRYRLHIATGD